MIDIYIDVISCSLSYCWLQVSYQGHVDGGTEWDSGHRVQDVDEHLGEDGGPGEEGAHCWDGGAGVYWDVRSDVSELYHFY